MNSVSTEKELQQNLIKHFYLAMKAMGSYPEGHPNVGEVINRAYNEISSLLISKQALTLSVAGDMLLFDETPIKSKQVFPARLIKDMAKFNVSSINLHKGLSQKEFNIFLQAMNEKPDHVQGLGGMAVFLQKKGISSIKVDQIKYGRISDENPDQSEISGIVDFLSGEVENLNGNRKDFFRILENEPEKLSDLIALVAETCDSSKHPYNEEGKSKVLIEVLQRISRQLLLSEGISPEHFKDRICSLLSSFDDNMLIHLGKAMNSLDGKRGDVIDKISNEFLIDTIADIYVEGYINKGKNNADPIKRLAHDKEGKKRIVACIKKKMEEHGLLDETCIVDYEFCDEPVMHPSQSQKVSADSNPDETFDEMKGSEGKHNKHTASIREKLNDLLAKGKITDAQSLIKEFSQSLDDKSWEIRRSVAETFHDVIEALNEFDSMKEGLLEISNLLLDKLHKEDHVETYITLDQDFRKLCETQEKADAYYIDETLGSRLLQAKKLTNAQLQQLLLARKKNGKSLQYNLGSLNLANEDVCVQ